MPVKLRKPRGRNSLYLLLQEYLRNQPDAKPAQAWAHFGSLAHLGGTPGLVSFDGQEIEFAPDPERFRTRMVSRESFFRQIRKIKTGLLGCVLN